MGFPEHGWTLYRDDTACAKCGWETWREHKSRPGVRQCERCKNVSQDHVHTVSQPPEQTCRACSFKAKKINP